MMSGLDAVRYNKDPIMLLYKVCSTKSSFSSDMTILFVAIGVLHGLQSSISNFFKSSLAYLS
ncbi:hypothetical protein HanRHA438_Chr17g0819411 [Helianthus annuus]|nr:hypothetical protein HanRHA438_Chr17g0819411 [Helianthus annuus]